MPATRLEFSIVINRPAEEVFAFVADPSNLSRWAENVLEVERTSGGPIGVGSTGRTVSNVMGRRIEQTMEVTEFQPNSSLALTGTSGPLRLHNRYTFEDADGSTRLTVVSDVEIGGMLRLLAPAIAAMGRRQVEADHTNLKRLLETQT